MSEDNQAPQITWVEEINYLYSNVAQMWFTPNDIHVAFAEQFLSGKLVNQHGTVMSLPQAKLFCRALTGLLNRIEALLGEIPTEPKVRQLNS